MPPAPEPPLDELIRTTLEACQEVHRRLGPGLPQPAYEEALCHELSHRSLGWQRRMPIAVYYRGVRLGTDFRVGVCVSARLLVDVLSTDGLLPVHRALLRSRLRFTGLPAGAAVNFRVAGFSGNVILIHRAQIQRVVQESTDLTPNQSRDLAGS